MKAKTVFLNDDEIRNLLEVYKVDVTDPQSVKHFKATTTEVSEEFYQLRRELNNLSNPHRKKSRPHGAQCTFCLKSENEVFSMAKLESGFNLCGECIKTVRRTGN